MASIVSEGVVNVPISELTQAITLNLIKQGHSADDAAVITDVLLYAELRANNQGIVKLVAGALRPNPASTAISVVFESPVSAKIDGGQRIGICVVSAAVDMAIAKAKTTGIALVGCSNYSSATGALGVWARRIARAGLVGIVMSQCPEMVAPHGSYEPIFGTNPIAIGLSTSTRTVVLDMATSASAYYGLVVAKEEGRTIPADIAYDAEGHATTDPAAAIKGALRVFDRGFKGSHLALMVELLAGAFTGAAMADKWAAKNWGSLVIAFDPAAFGADNTQAFDASASVLLERVKNAKNLPGHEGEEHYLPGERGDQLEAVHLAQGYLPLSSRIFNQLVEANNAV